MCGWTFKRKYFNKDCELIYKFEQINNKLRKAQAGYSLVLCSVQCGSLHAYDHVRLLVFACSHLDLMLKSLAASGRF